MNRPLLPALLLASIGGASCNCLSDHVVDFSSTPVSSIGDGSYRYGATTDGQMIWWDVSFADVEKTPDWLPGEEPPLSVSTAIRLAEQEVPKYASIPAAYRLEQVEWMHIGNHMDDLRKWIYLVTFEREYRYGGQTFDARGTLRIPVLLDGRVIQGKKE